MLAIAECAEVRRSAPVARPVAESTDKALIKAIGRGDRTAMQALYGRHNVRVYRFLLRLTHDPSLAEELVGDVFFAVWRQAGHFAGRSLVSTWILAIARHKAYSAARRRPHEQPLSERIADTVVDPADDAEAMIVHDDRSAALQTCLAKLSPEHREVIDLAYYHDKTVDEVAEITGVPKNTVKTRMFYARKCLAKLLATSEGVDDDLRARALH
jgi:RNA polymerase sigma-70 factor (ECF subfamily)